MPKKGTCSPAQTDASYMILLICTQRKPLWLRKDDRSDPFGVHKQGLEGLGLGA